MTRKEQEKYFQKKGFTDHGLFWRKGFTEVDSDNLKIKTTISKKWTFVPCFEDLDSYINYFERL